MQTHFEDIPIGLPLIFIVSPSHSSNISGQKRMEKSTSNLQILSIIQTIAPTPKTMTLPY
jgi:hypothetical protein